MSVYGNTRAVQPISGMMTLRSSPIKSGNDAKWGMGHGITSYDYCITSTTSNNVYNKKAIAHRID
jgi:hypothetical protein